jgi:hypothetical protein
MIIDNGTQIVQPYYTCAPMLGPGDEYQYEPLGVVPRARHVWKIEDFFPSRCQSPILGFELLKQVE